MKIKLSNCIAESGMGKALAEEKWVLAEQLEDDLWQEGVNLTIVQKNNNRCEINWLDSPQ